MDDIIRVEGAEEIIRRITSIQGLERVKASIQQAGIMLKGYLQAYPKVSRRPNDMLRGDSEKSARMRRGFFYHLRKGDIEVPYYRGQNPKSEKLGQSWTVSAGNNEFSAFIGTNVSYASMVQNKEAQTGYHRTTGWVTVQDVKENHQQEVIDFIASALDREVENG
jgi:phage gpG-like protein